MGKIRRSRGAREEARRRSRHVVSREPRQPQHVAHRRSARGWNVDFICAEAVQPGVKSLRGDGSIDQRGAATVEVDGDAQAQSGAAGPHRQARSRASSGADERLAAKAQMLARCSRKTGTSAAGSRSITSTARMPSPRTRSAPSIVPGPKCRASRASARKQGRPRRRRIDYGGSSPRRRRAYVQ